jgi:hypothetical protein
LDGVAVAAIHPDFGLPEGPTSRTRRVAWSSGRQELLQQAAANPLADTIKPRGHEAAEMFPSPGCSRCDAMFDPFGLADAVADAQDAAWSAWSTELVHSRIPVHRIDGRCWPVDQRGLVHCRVSRLRLTDPCVCGASVRLLTVGRRLASVATTSQLADAQVTVMVR